MTTEEPRTTPPPTRWALAGADNSYYVETFTGLLAEGADVAGEARLADALVPRGARVLDAGSGMGRVAAELAGRGHQVVAVEPDPSLVAASRAAYPGLEVITADVLEVDRARLRALGRPDAFDLVVCVGNVLLFTADGTEQAFLERVAGLLAPEGRVLAGFHLQDPPPAARSYPVETFLQHVAAAGLVVDARFGSYDLRPAADEYAVWLLARAADRPAG